MSAELREIPSGGVARGRVRVPPSKSVSHRQLNLALLGGRALRLRHPLQADDIRHFVGALEVLGYRVAWGGEDLVLEPPSDYTVAGRVDCGNAGTLMRFLAASLTTVPGAWILDGSERMRERPIGPLVEALRGLGAEIDYVGTHGFPPLAITGGSFEGGETEIDAGESSQYLSALVMAALSGRRPSRIKVRALTSSPYVDITARLVERWGGSLRVDGDFWIVEPGLEPPAVESVEGDYSAAPYPATAAVLSGGKVLLEGLDPDSAQGDREFFGLLSQMGADVAWRDGALEVQGGGGLRGLDVDLGSMPDQVPTLAALAPFARGITRIRNVGHLRIKESDRLAAMATELSRLGATVEELPDGLVIEGTWAEVEPPSDRVVVQTYDDHRIAMSLALVGLRRPGVVVAEPGVVSKSYPGFWLDLERLLGWPR
ncbi:MAG: 3-phosphoshikimate 1-carboxyvinyltransferase [Thermoanaerobaculia bacterium]|nr:3-phosphoshikimate 1-carboxyvinyltransferase [Thermoanaerobaculia bacterium]